MKDIDLESQLMRSLSDSNFSSSSEEDNNDSQNNTIKYQKFLFKNLFMVLILIFLFGQIVYNESENTDKYFSLLLFIIYYVSKMNLKKKKNKRNTE